jgi:hypothetical protein
MFQLIFRRDSSSVPRINICRFRLRSWCMTTKRSPGTRRCCAAEQMTLSRYNARSALTGASTSATFAPRYARHSPLLSHRWPSRPKGQRTTHISATRSLRILTLRTFRAMRVPYWSSTQSCAPAPHSRLLLRTATRSITTANTTTTSLPTNLTRPFNTRRPHHPTRPSIIRQCTVLGTKNMIQASTDTATSLATAMELRRIIGTRAWRQVLDQSMS